MAIRGYLCRHDFCNLGWADLGGTWFTSKPKDCRCATLRLRVCALRGAPAAWRQKSLNFSTALCSIFVDTTSTTLRGPIWTVSFCLSRYLLVGYYLSVHMTVELNKIWVKG